MSFLGLRLWWVAAARLSFLEASSVVTAEANMDWQTNGGQGVGFVFLVIHSSV